MCIDIDECELYNPCDGKSTCVNQNPGFRCEPCPMGYDGMHAYGKRYLQIFRFYILKNFFLGYYAEYWTHNYQKQTCFDIDECQNGMARCGPNSVCVNTMVGFI